MQYTAVTADLRTTQEKALTSAIAEVIVDEYVHKYYEYYKAELFSGGELSQREGLLEDIAALTLERLHKLNIKVGEEFYLTEYEDFYYKKCYCFSVEDCEPEEECELTKVYVNVVYAEESADERVLYLRVRFAYYPDARNDAWWGQEQAFVRVVYKSR